MFNQTAISSSGDDVFEIRNRTCSLSEMKNFESIRIFLALILNLLFIFLMSFSSPDRAIFMLMFAFLSLSNNSEKNLDFSWTSWVEVHMIISFFEFSNSSFRWLYIVDFPFTAPEMSSCFIGWIPVEYSCCSSLYSSVSFNFVMFSIFSSVSFIVFVFSFSITMFGFTAMYFTGLPSFIIANPRFSKLSRTS